MKFDLSAEQFQDFVCDALDVAAEQHRMLAKAEDLNASANRPKMLQHQFAANELQRFADFFRLQRLDYDIPDVLLLPATETTSEPISPETVPQPEAVPFPDNTGTGGFVPPVGTGTGLDLDNLRVIGTGDAPDNNAPVITGVVHNEPVGTIQLDEPVDEPTPIKRGRPKKA